MGSEQKSEAQVQGSTLPVVPAENGESEGAAGNKVLAEPIDENLRWIE